MVGFHVWFPPATPIDRTRHSGFVPSATCSNTTRSGPERGRTRANMHRITASHPFARVANRTATPSESTSRLGFAEPVTRKTGQGGLARNAMLIARPSRMANAPRAMRSAAITRARKSIKRRLASTAKRRATGYGQRCSLPTVAVVLARSAPRRIRHSSPSIMSGVAVRHIGPKWVATRTGISGARAGHRMVTAFSAGIATP